MLLVSLDSLTFCNYKLLHASEMLHILEVKFSLLRRNLSFFVFFLHQRMLKRTLCVETALYLILFTPFTNFRV